MSRQKNTATGTIPNIVPAVREVFMLQFSFFKFIVTVKILGRGSRSPDCDRYDVGRSVVVCLRTRDENTKYSEEVCMYDCLTCNAKEKGI